MMLFLICLFSMPLTWAQLQSERSVTDELRVKNSAEAKPYLLFKAIYEALPQYASEMGINDEEFKNKLNQKFESYFEVYKERKLTEKFGKTYSAHLTNEQKDEFLKGLESHRKLEMIKFSRLNEVVDNYLFKQLENDPKSPSTWNGILTININRVKLDSLIKRISSNVTKQYARINLISEFNLIGFNWSELGLEKGSSFSEPLLESWSKWLITNQPSNVEDIVICSESCINDFNQWQQLPQDEGLQVAADLMNNLWLKVSFNLRKLSFVPNLNEWTFEWEGRVVLLDANTKRVLATQELFSETKSWRGLDQKSINSALASQMYRAPLGAFNTFVRKITDLPQLNRVVRLVIQGQKHLGDVVSLMELLKKEGKSIGLDLQLDLFTQNQAQLLGFYQGEEKSFSDLLSRPKELKSSQSYRLVNEFTGVHHLLKLVAE